MARGKGKHLTRDNREVIEQGLRDGESASKIGAKISRGASTVTREVRRNRTVKEPRRRAGARLAVRCERYRECERVGKACEGRETGYTRCKDCRTHSCIDTCPDFVLRMCPTTGRWPYVCPAKCPKRPNCTYPKCSYSADEADGIYRERLAASREGADLTEAELAELDAKVAPLVRQGHSFAAICAEEDVPVSSRTLHDYQEQGLLSTTHLDLPRKARVKPRKKAKKGEKARERVDRDGRRHGDFQALPIEDQARVAGGDSVCGFQSNKNDVLSLMFAARKSRLYLPRGHEDPSETVRCLDAIETAMGSPEAFEAALGVLLLDRGKEFDDFEGMERSCLDPSKRRCRVLYCDAQDSNQKSRCERNHEQLRRILPKGRTDMDALTADDVALCCCHASSYPLESLGGRTPFDSLGGLLPDDVLALVGVVRMDPKAVVLKPSLVPHAVEQ